MKKIILVIIICLFGFTSFSQTYQHKSVAIPVNKIVDNNVTITSIETKNDTVFVYRVHDIIKGITRYWTEYVDVYIIRGNGLVFVRKKLIDYVEYRD